MDDNCKKNRRDSESLTVFSYILIVTSCFFLDKKLASRLLYSHVLILLIEYYEENNHDSRDDGTFI